MLKHSGIFEGPPALEKAIRDWMFSTFAAHTLHHVETELISVAGFQAAADAIDEFVRTLPAKAMKLAPLQTFRFVVPPVPGLEGLVLGTRRYSAISRDGSPLFSIEAGKKALKDLGYGAVQLDMVVDRLTGKAEAYKEKLLRNMKEVQGIAANSAETERNDIVRRSLLRKECHKYTQTSKRYTTKASREFPLDLNGWKYVQAGSPVVQEYNDIIQKENTRLETDIKDSLRELAWAQEVYDRVKGGELTTDDVQVPDDVVVRYWDMSRLSDAVKAGKRPNTAYVLMGAWLPRPSGEHRKVSEYVTVDEARKDMFAVLGPDDVIKAVHWKWPKITAVLYFITHTRRGGQWSLVEKELRWILETESTLHEVLSRSTSVWPPSLIQSATRCSTSDRTFLE